MSTGVWTATITWVRANKTTVLTGAEKIQLDGNVYTLESNVYAVAGALVASVELYKDGSRLTTCQFTCKGQRAVIRRRRDTFARRIQC